MTTEPPLERTEEQRSQSYFGALHIIMIVAYADEEFSEPERQMMKTQARALARSDEEVKSLEQFVESLPPRVESSGWVEQALAKVKASVTDRQARRDAFAMALEVAAADGRIDMRETGALLEIAAGLEIDPEFARVCLKRVRTAPLGKLPDLDKTPWQSTPPIKRA